MGKPTREEVEQADTEAPKVATAEVEQAYAEALKVATRRGGGHDELTQVAIDGATDGVLWALEHYDPAHTGKGFGAFCAASVRRFVWRRIDQHIKKSRKRPRVLHIDDQQRHEDCEADSWLEDKRTGGTGEIPMPQAVTDLPPDLRDAVCLFYVHKFDLRECGLLCGVAMETVRQRLSRAARILGDGYAAPPRDNGERRLVR